jgi:iron complex transport system ATP-binding protein
MAVIKIENVSFSYGTSEIIRNMSLAVEKGSFLAVAGPNGAGKSTLINLICRILKPDSGTISVFDKKLEKYPIDQFAKLIAVVRQEFVPVFAFSVIETVTMARTTYLKGLGFESKQDRDAVIEALELTDTLKFADRNLGQLSGGERQRVFIARAIAQQSPILLLDEPTNFLDLKHQVDVYDLLKKMQREQGKTIVLISHDLNLAAQYCDRILLIGTDKEYFLGDSREVLDPELVSKFFGVKGFSGSTGSQRFFLPLGKMSKDRPA